MGNGMNKVLPGLYLGSFRDSKDTVQLSENKITHILSIHDNSRPLLMDKVYLCIPASDCPTQNISQYFSQCNDFIHDARVTGGNVLVHCLAGVSRSVTIVVAYIMSVTELGWRDSLNAVRGARNCASPNFGFQRQLLEFQHENLLQEKERLKAGFPSSPFPDLEECRKLLEINAQWVKNGEQSMYLSSLDTENDKIAAEGQGEGTDGDTKSSLHNIDKQNNMQNACNGDLLNETVRLGFLTVSDSSNRPESDGHQESDVKPFGCSDVRESSVKTRTEPEDGVSCNTNSVTGEELRSDSISLNTESTVCPNRSPKKESQ